MTCLAVATRRPDRDGIHGDLLKAAMDATQTSSAALARVLDVDKTTVYRWREGVFDKKKNQLMWLITPLVWRACMSAMRLPPDWKPGDPAPAKPTGLDDVG